MFNYILHTSNVVNADYYKIYKSLAELSELTISGGADNNDHFYIEDNLLSENHISGRDMMEVLNCLLPNEQFCKLVIPILIGKLEECQVVPDDINQLDQQFPDQKNAYWGALFGRRKTFYQLCRVDDYYRFRYYYVNHVEPDDIWKHRGLIFKSIILCDNVETEINVFGGGALFKGIVDRLKALDRYAQDWKNGNFEINVLKTYVNASDEHRETMKIPKLAQMRVFKINDEIGSKTCSFHVKFRNKRFHFYPDNNTRTIYVAYIGNHLKTKRFRN